MHRAAAVRANRGRSVGANPGPTRKVGATTKGEALPPPPSPTGRVGLAGHGTESVTTLLIPGAGAPPVVMMFTVPLCEGTVSEAA